MDIPLILENLFLGYTLYYHNNTVFLPPNYKEFLMLYMKEYLRQTKPIFLGKTREETVSAFIKADGIEETY